MPSRLRDRWVAANAAQRSTLVAGACTLFMLLSSVTPSAAPGGATPRYVCRNPETGLPVIIAGSAGDTPSEIASRYCVGDVAAAQRALEERARVTENTIMHGAILRLPCDS